MIVDKNQILLSVGLKFARRHERYGQVYNINITNAQLISNCGLKMEQINCIDLSDEKKDI